jgi:cytochrome b subunit of formate dehydrogenase
MQSNPRQPKGDIVKSKVGVVIGIILWVLVGLSLVVLVRDIHILNRIGTGTELLRVIHAYRQNLALTEGIGMIVFLIPAYLLTRSHLQRIKPCVALVIGFVTAILLGINASYVFMPEVPRLSYPTAR